MNTKILITGAGGQLGQVLARRLGPRGVACDSSQLDVTDQGQVRRQLAAFRPLAVINCAAFTQVDQCEREVARAHAVNATAVAYLAEACRRIDAVLVQVSTDYVFGGDANRSRPWLETDRPQPECVYAASKLAGEVHAAGWARHFIVRTCGLYGEASRHGNFVEKMLALAECRDRIQVVNDQHCTPTFVEHLVPAILFLCDCSAYGTYHLVNQGATTWYEFAREIFRLSNRVVEVEPITSWQFAAAAQRPRCSVLDTTKYQRLGGPSLPPWRDALAEYLRQRLAAGSTSAARRLR